MRGEGACLAPCAAPGPCAAALSVKDRCINQPASQQAGMTAALAWQEWLALANQQTSCCWLVASWSCCHYLPYNPAACLTCRCLRRSPANLTVW